MIFDFLIFHSMNMSLSNFPFQRFVRMKIYGKKKSNLLGEKILSHAIFVDQFVLNDDSAEKDAEKDAEKFEKLPEKEIQKEVKQVVLYRDEKKRSSMQGQLGAMFGAMWSTAKDSVSSVKENLKEGVESVKSAAERAASGSKTSVPSGSETKEEALCGTDLSSSSQTLLCGKTEKSSSTSCSSSTSSNPIPEGEVTNSLFKDDTAEPFVVLLSKDSRSAASGNSVIRVKQMALAEFAKTPQMEKGLRSAGQKDKEEKGSVKEKEVNGRKDPIVEFSKLPSPVRAVAGNNVVQRPSTSTCPSVRFYF